MAKCRSCAAPLPANTNRCRYCGVRNDVDLQEKHAYHIQSQVSERICPHCEQPLQSIQLQLAETLSIERCDKCFGLFFGLGELDTLLQYSVSEVHTVNLRHLDNINIDRYRKNQVVKYIKCPVCRAFMHRTNFAQRSGVIVDSCRQHGLWLDSGEVTHLMEWKKMGGQLLHEQVQQEKRHKRKRLQRQPRDEQWSPAASAGGMGLETDLLDLLAQLVRKLFS